MHIIRELCLVYVICESFHATFISVVPTAPPVNVTVIAKTSRTFTLSWNPPTFEEQNGIIRQYMINVTHLETGINFQVVSNKSEISVDSLKPTHTYVCHVAAQTIGLSPYSSVIQVELLEYGNPTYTFNVY